MKDKENLTKCLSARLKWYDKAIAMKEGKIPYENGFDLPDGDIGVWQGASRELKNTLDMLSAMKLSLAVETGYGTIEAVAKEDNDYPGIRVAHNTGSSLVTIATVEFVESSRGIQTVCYCADSDDPRTIVLYGRARESGEQREKSCVLCGTKMVWEHPDIPGLYMESSCYIGTDYCYDCMREHCQQTNCLACEIGEYPKCRHQGLKNNDE